MEILQEILQGMKKTKGRVQHVAAELRSRYESTFCGRAGGEGMVSRLPGNMHERTMRCNVTPEIQTSGREREVAQYDGKGSRSVATGKRWE